MGIIESIVGIVIASTIGAMGVGAVGINVIGATIVAGVIWGGNAISKSLAPKKDSNQSSPTYQFNSLQTQTNNQLPIALIYGENKLAGNRIWQQLRDGTAIDRIIALGQGEIESIEDMRLNDIKVSDISRIAVRTYLGTGAPESLNAKKPVDTVVPGDELKRIKTVGSLKGLAYIAISVRAGEKIRADYNFTALVKGRKVRVYQDIDTWIYKYSNNPVWCLLDFLICYNGCGMGLLEDGTLDDNKIKEAIDIQSFIESAEYCDELVVPNIEGEASSNEGQQVKRFTFNMIIDSRAPRHEIIEEFKKACRGALTLKGKKLQFKIDRPSAPCKEILANDIIPGSEQYSTIANEENYDRIIVKYRSKANDWAICEAIAEKSIFDNIPPVEHEVNIYGVTDFNQASRLAWYYLNKLLKERDTGYFETDSRAFDLEIGDIILLSDNLMGYIQLPVKITQLGDMQDGRFGVHWRIFKEEVFTDTLGSKNPSTQVLFLQNGVPYIVENFIVSQNFFGLTLSWDIANQDCKYEVRVGSNWNNGEVVATNITTNSLFFFPTKTGTYHFFLKAKNQYGIYSNEAASCSIYVSSVPNANTILKHSCFNILHSLTHGKIYNQIIKPSAIGLWTKTSLVSKEQASILNQEIWQSFNKNCWTYTSTSESTIYITKVFELDAITETLISIDMSYLGQQKGGLWYFRSSRNGIDWTSYELLTPKIVTFKYYQLKFEHPPGFFLSKDSTLTLDVEDRIESYQNIELDAQDGVTIYFATHPQSKLKHSFFKEVSVIASLTQSNGGYCIISEKTLDYVKIKALSPTGVGIAGICDVHVKGF